MRSLVVRISVVVCAAVALAACSASHDGERGRATTNATPARTAATPPGRAASTSPAGSPGPGEHLGPNAVSFVSADLGWALGPAACPACGDIWETTDGGGHWQVRSASVRVPGEAGAVAEGLVDIDFVDTRHGYLFVSERCAADCVMTTSDAGRTWRATTLPATVQLVDGTNTVYALTAVAGDHGPELFRNVPGRPDWQRLTTPPVDGSTNSWIPAYLAADSGTVALLQRGIYLAGRGRRGKLWISVDGGGHWLSRPNPCRATDGGAALVSIALHHPDAMLIDCFDDEQSSQAQNTQHHLYGSTDGGRTWVRLADPSETGDPLSLADNGEEHAVLTTENGAGEQLHATVDAAARWRTVLTAGGNFYGFGDLRFVTAGVGFVLGPTHYSPEHLYRTDDGGRTWRRVPTPTS